MHFAIKYTPIVFGGYYQFTITSAPPTMFCLSDKLHLEHVCQGLKLTTHHSPWRVHISPGEYQQIRTGHANIWCN